MSKLLTVRRNKGEGEEALVFYCPGCRMDHRFIIKPPLWKFDGNWEAPTFTPSLKWDSKGVTQCHLIITNGLIDFCNDCTHDLAGKKKVPMVEV